MSFAALDSKVLQEALHLNMVFWLLAMLLKAETCKVWTCVSQTDPSICLTWSGDAVIVNTQGCTSYQEECTYSTAVAAIAQASSGTYKCEQAATSQQSFSFVSCGKREPQQRRLKTGVFPKECQAEGTQDPACQLEDGTMLLCKCGLDGKKYCQPNPSDVPFDEYWTACGQEGYVVQDAFFQYYKLKHDLFVELTSAPSCVPSLIYEFSKLASPAPNYSSAVFLSLSTLFLL